MPKLQNQPIVQQISPPASTRIHCTLGRIDYSDAFLVSRSSAPDRTAEQWARSMIEDAPAKRRRALLVGWSALGLRLGWPWSDRSVLGWEIRRDEPDVLLLGAGSRFGLAGELLFVLQPDTLLFSTLVRLNNPVARAVWSSIAPKHCRVVSHLLREASRPVPESPDRGFQQSSSGEDCVVQLDS